MAINSKPATVREIQKLEAFEKKNKFSFPLSYKNFLYTTNGGVPIYNTFAFNNREFEVQIFYSLLEQPDYNNLYNVLFTFINRIPAYFVPIGCDSFGNQYLLNMRKEYSGHIYFWDHEGELIEGDTSEYFENVTWLSGSFEDFVHQLKDQN